jgi:Uma2 family endonuclease
MAFPNVRRHQWTRESFDRMVEAGGFDEDDRIELLDGELWDLSPPGSRHTTGTRLVEEALRSAFRSGYEVRSENPLALDDTSQPQPDVMVVPGSIRDYTYTHPSQALLLVEVSDSTLSHDRGRKPAAYCRNGVPEYWALDLQAARLEVYRDPSGMSSQSKSVLATQDMVSPLHAPDCVIAVADLLP